jgi:hypothetical protein
MCNLRAGDKVRVIDAYNKVEGEGVPPGWEVNNGEVLTVSHVRRLPTGEWRVFSDSLASCYAPAHFELVSSASNVPEGCITPPTKRRKYGT